MRLNTPAGPLNVVTHEELQGLLNQLAAALTKLKQEVEELKRRVDEMGVTLAAVNVAAASSIPVEGMVVASRRYDDIEDAVIIEHDSDLESILDD